MALELDDLTLLLLTHIKPLCLGAAIPLFLGPQGVPCLLWSCQIPWYLSWSAVFLPGFLPFHLWVFSPGLWHPALPGPFGADVERCHRCMVGQHRGDQATM